MHLAADLADHDLSLMADFTTTFLNGLTTTTTGNLRNEISTWETRTRDGLKDAYCQLHAEVKDLDLRRTNLGGGLLTFG